MERYHIIIPLSPCSYFRRLGQGEIDSRALVVAFRLHPSRPTMPLNDFLNNGKANACPRDIVLGVKPFEGLEYQIMVCGFDPPTIVPDCYNDLCFIF